MGGYIGLIMAKTKRDKLKNKLKRIHREQRKARDLREYFRLRASEDVMAYEDKATGGQIMNDPAWWNHLYDIVPARRRTKALLDKIKKVPGVVDEIVFPDYKRPHIYYW